jgi:copper chaperone
MAEVTLRVDGMHCGSCVGRVSHALSSTPGIEVKEVRIGAARFVSADEPEAADRAIAALAQAGYKAHLDQSEQQ